MAEARPTRKKQQEAAGSARSARPDPAAGPKAEAGPKAKAAPKTTAGPSLPQPITGAGSPRDPLLLPVQYLKGVGPAKARALNKLGVETVMDLLEHFPRRHEDRSQFKPIAQVADGQLETVQGVVTGVQEMRPRRGLHILKVGVTDGLGLCWGVWFNQPFRRGHFQPGQRVIFSGRVERRYNQIQFSNPEYEAVEDGDPLHTGRLVPIYPLTEGFTARMMRSLMKGVVDQYTPGLPETLPADLRGRHRLGGRAGAWYHIHFPASDKHLEAARKRLVFDELFLLQLGLALMKSSYAEETPGLQHRPDGPLVAQFLAALPYRLTGAQQRAYEDIRGDMESPRPMNRLLQGDVGSGKTVVATLALVKAVASGYQGVLMAPTEILAEQHFLVLRRWLEPLGIRVALVSGGLPRREKATLLRALATGVVHVAVGTHALIQEGVAFHRLGLVVTDEQHRFGVRQRALLLDKGAASHAVAPTEEGGPPPPPADEAARVETAVADGARVSPAGPVPDVLVMTATPIPRTLALTLYGDLEVSVIDELPPGRTPVETRWFTDKEKRRVYGLVRQQVAEGRQAYVVCPLVEESEKVQAEAATALAERLSQEEFPDLTVGLLHGRMKPEEKDRAMAAFRSGQMQVMVATTVIEVGVDVPNATVMVVEGADRFGLAQLHQLRGRVGRGAHKSYCLLVASPTSEEGRQRLLVMQRTQSGFEIAEEDLKLRGPGEFFGTRQHGLPDLKIADPLRDQKVLEVARQEALALVAQDRRLRSPELAALREQVRHKFRERAGLIQVG